MNDQQQTRRDSFSGEPTPAPETTSPTVRDDRSVAELMQAMGRGERGAAASLVTRYGPQIRRRVRGKLHASTRRVFDSQDILSTLGRRLDVYVHRGRFTARSEAELWGLVYKIAEHSLVEKARIVKLMVNTEGASGDFGRQVAARFRDAERSTGVDSSLEDGLEELLKQIDCPIDRQIARLWTWGRTSEEIAADTGLTANAVRLRFAKLKAHLREKFGDMAA